MLVFSGALPLSFLHVSLTPVLPTRPVANGVVGAELVMFGGGKRAVPKKAKKTAKPVAKKPVAKKSVAKKSAAKPRVKPSGPYKPQYETQATLVQLAEQQNTALGFWDPIGLAQQDFWNQGNEATIGFLRHAEIKHGRVAMAAFVGYCVQANGIAWPWAITGGPLTDGRFGDTFGSNPTIMFSEIAAAGSPPAQWDALPTAAKVQILLTIAILEWVGESPQPGMPHYMRGGKPGYYPSLKDAYKYTGVPHPVPLNLYDPFGLFEDMDEETKARRRNMEINNGRLAMFGIFSLISAAKGLEVPGLTGLLEAYDGEPMAYFSPTDSGLPFLDTMLNLKVFPDP
jgi:hypothetical protein